MFDAVEGLVAEHAELEGRLAAPETHADQRLAKRLNQRYAELSAIVRTWREWQQLGDDIGAARELASEDAPLRRGGGAPSASGGSSWRSTCATCWCRATPTTPRTPCSR